MKKIKLKYNIGKVKYVIKYHDGEAKHKDGSEFWGIYTFKNKVKFNAAIKDLIKKGYIHA